MRVGAGALVRRWGGRAVMLAVTGVGLYVVAPSLLSAFGAWPGLAEVKPRWFVILVVLETLSLASLWWLTRLALEPDPVRLPDPDDVLDPESTASHEMAEALATSHRVAWGTVATAQLAGTAASRVVPGGAATGGVVQGRLLIQAGQPAASVASALTGVGLITTAVLLLLPVLTLPALLIGPPPEEQLRLGLVVSLIVAVVIVGVGVTVLTWPRVLVVAGRLVGHVIHRVRPSVTADSTATLLSAQRARVAAAFQGRWWLAVFLAAANRMFDYAALVAALAAFGVRARPSEVLLAFVVAQALAMVPITPGGLGFVESGLTALLVVIGVPADISVIATLLYRLVSFWLPIPIGVLAWAGWRIHLGRTGSPSSPRVDSD
jgi:uncharacterized protein (TIRG00374 family)